MAQGFLRGALLGVVVGGGALVVANHVVERPSLGIPQPETVNAPAKAPVPDSAEFAEVTQADDPVAPAPETPVISEPQAVATPVAPAVEEEVQPALDAAPARTPVSVADAPESPAAPDAPEAPDVASAPDAVVGGRSDVAVPDQPASDAPLVSGLNAPEPPAAPEPVVPTPEPVAEAPRIVAQTPVVREAPAPQVVVQTPVVREAPSSQPAAQPPADPTPQEPEIPVAAADSGRVIPPKPTAPPPSSTQPPAADPQEASPSGMKRVLAPSGGSSMPGQRVSGLPGQSGLRVAAAEPATETAPAPSRVAVDTGEGPALQRFATPFDASSAQPRVSIVMVIPETGSEVAVQALTALPFPISYGVHAAASDAAETAATLRDAGAEILLVPSLPAGANASDVEQSLQANLAVIPQAVAFMDVPEASFQADREAIAQVIQAAGASGHGVLTYPRGLNTAQKIAERDGVPSGVVFRDLDGQGQDAAAIRRTLDQAAFRARQEGGVILVGRARPATVAALTEWALGSRAESVALAPVSAVILQQ